MISAIFKKGLDNNPQKIAIYDENNTYSYEDLDKRIASLASGMVSLLGLGKNDVIAIQASNRIEFVLTLYACWRLGVSVTTMNPSLQPDEIIHQLTDSKASVFFYENSCKEKARIAAGQIGEKIEQVLFIGEKNDKELSFKSLFINEYVEEGEVCQNTVALIIYTSGTTGKPKGVLLTHRNVMSMLHSAITTFELKESDRAYLIMPLFHVNSIHLTLSAPIYLGASVILTNRFIPEKFLENIEQMQPTYMVGVPTMFKMLADLPTEKIENYDLGSLNFGLCGGAPITKSEFYKFQRKYSFPLIEAWGLSEATTCTTSNPLHGVRKIGSIGIPMPGQKVKVVNENGKEVPCGEHGELIIQGETVMAGYLNNNKETSETISNGWLYTGDMGFEDEEGYFYIVGRKKDIIIRGGINIYPKQIEEILYQLSSVKEAAVIGVPDEKYGEEVVAFVSLNESETNEEDIIKYCKEKLANYKCPVKVYILDSLPKNSIGKITKKELKKITV